jgi:hypothetical protein
VLRKNDSVVDVYYSKAEQVLSIAGEMNLPIGYSKSSAPVSWISGTSNQARVDGSRRLQEYLNARNEGSPGEAMRYCIGICISGFSLGVGAPFWFALLMRFVDIRRAGKKPLITTKKEET